MQTDLFQSTSTFTAKQPEKPSFLDRYRFNLRLDQLVVGTIGLIIASVFIFTFGVETGKKFAFEELKAERSKREKMVEEFRAQIISMMDKTAGSAPTASGSSVKQPAVPAVDKAQVAAKPTEKKTAAESTASQTSIKDGNYTIQLIAYTSQDTAKKELQRLADKGLKGFIIPNGKFLQICVNAFETKTKAMAALDQMKTSGVAPQDAYVRSISQTA